MTDTQIPFVTTRCGYCDRPLVFVNDERGSHYQCARCAPLLANVSTPEQWAQFQRDARLKPVIKRVPEYGWAAFDRATGAKLHGNDLGPWWVSRKAVAAVLASEASS